MQPTHQTEKQDKKAYWGEIIAAWKASGKTKAAFCKERGLTANYLSTWHQRLLREEETNTAIFVPVTLRKSKPIAKDKSLSSEPLVMELNHDIRVTITTQTDKAALRLFLEVIGVVSC